MTVTKLNADSCGTMLDQISSSKIIDIPYPLQANNSQEGQTFQRLFRVYLVIWNELICDDHIPPFDVGEQKR